jgi:hypothetical protein
VARPDVLLVPGGPIAGQYAAEGHSPHSTPVPRRRRPNRSMT